MVLTKEMSIIEVVQKYPQTMRVFSEFGMGCIGCMAAQFENIGQGAEAHGIDVEALMAALNKSVTEKPVPGCGCCGH